ncbi:MAG: hypothetical protein HWD58_11620 [Bacteroidota bacterium]|nr:MAG: hypothetical protein HWD58_11620 [Bacteroidota bacterium]
MVTSLPTLGQNNQWIRTIEEQAVLMVPGQHGTLYSLSWQTNCPDDYIVVRFYKPDGTVQHAFKSFVYLGLITTYKAFTNSSNHLVLYLRDNGTNHMLYEFDSSGVMIGTTIFSSPLRKSSTMNLFLARIVFISLGVMMFFPVSIPAMPISPN